MNCGRCWPYHGSFGESQASHGRGTGFNPRCLYENCGGKSGTVTGLSPSTSFSPCQYLSTNAPYPFIQLPPTLYNVSLPVLQFSPVSIIPPMFYIHLYLNTFLIRRAVSNVSCMTSLAWTNWGQWQQSSFGINASLPTVDRTIFLGRCWNASALKRVCLVFNMVNLTFRDTWGAVRLDLRRLTHGLELIATVNAQCGIRTLP